MINDTLIKLGKNLSHVISEELTLPEDEKRS